MGMCQCLPTVELCLDTEDSVFTINDIYLYMETC